MARGMLILVVAVLAINFAIGTLGFAFKFDRFPYDISELLSWMFA